MLMRIFTPSLYFQCVFNDFQCVITLLRALSVALIFSVGHLVRYSYIFLSDIRKNCPTGPTNFDSTEGVENSCSLNVSTDGELTTASGSEFQDIMVRGKNDHL